MTGDDESWMNRRNFVYGLLTGGTVVSSGAVGAFLFRDDIEDLLEPDEDDQGEGPGTGTPDQDDGYGTPPTDDYDGPEDGYTTTPEGPVDTWNEALPGGCSLSRPQRNWLKNQVDSHEGMNKDEFFDYIESGRVNLNKDGDELRMLVDENDDGQYDQGYSVPDAC